MQSKPFYYTKKGQAYVGDSLELLAELPDSRKKNKGGRPCRTCLTLIRRDREGQMGFALDI